MCQCISRPGLLALLFLLSLLCSCVKPPVDPADLIPPAGEWTPVEAAWYGELNHGRKTASGELFDMRKPTAAHSHLPFGTVLEIRIPGTEHVTRVTVTDRANEERGVELLLSKAAAEQLGLVKERRFLVEYRWLE